MPRNQRKDRSIEILKEINKIVEHPAWFDIEKSPLPLPKKYNRYVGTFQVSHHPKWIT